MADATGQTLTIIPIESLTLGDRSYLVHDGEVALLIDPDPVPSTVGGHDAHPGRAGGC